MFQHVPGAREDLITNHSISPNALVNAAQYSEHRLQIRSDMAIFQNMVYTWFQLQRLENSKPRTSR